LQGAIGSLLGNTSTERLGRERTKEIKVICCRAWPGSLALVSARSGGELRKKNMNEAFEPQVDTLKKNVSKFGVEATERLSAQLKRDPAKTLAIILAGSVLVSAAIGYRIARTEHESRRQRLFEDWMKEVTDWIRQNGRKIAAPIQEGVEATKSAVGDVSNSTAKQWLPFFEKQKRSFLNLF
jgi:hypothetical protein